MIIQIKIDINRNYATIKYQRVEVVCTSLVWRHHAVTWETATSGSSAMRITQGAPLLLVHIQHFCISQNLSGPIGFM